MKAAQMADVPMRRQWLGRLIFAALCFVIILSHLIPLETVPPSIGGPSLIITDTDGPNVIDDTVAATQERTAYIPDPIRWIAPDFLLLLALTWVVRRPSFTPALLIAAAFLLADFLFQRPPGLWAGLVLILSEILRRRARSLRTLPFWIEWSTVTIGIAAITMIDRFTLTMVAVPQASMGLTLLQLTLTIIAYPVVVFVSYAVFGVSRPAPGQVDALGHKL